MIIALFVMILLVFFVNIDFIQMKMENVKNVKWIIVFINLMKILVVLVKKDTLYVPLDIIIVLELIVLNVTI